ncbi:MAG: permease [Gemmatimonadetes bacterium]|nr:permease [Gemmatimonadota bacterium]
MDTLWMDVRLTLRTLLKSPLFLLVTTATLALGIGATTTVFSVANAAFLRPLPVRDAGRLLAASEVTGRGGMASDFSYPDYLQYAAAAAPVADVAVSGLQPFGLKLEGAPVSVTGAFVSGSFFPLMGITPAAGRFFGPAEDGPAVAQVPAVLSYDAWRTRFAGDAAVVGRTIVVNGRSVTVTGVAPKGFTGVFLGVAPEIWVPIQSRPTLAPGMVDPAPGKGRRSWLQMLARPHAGVDADRVAAALSVAARRLDRGADETQRNGALGGVRLDRAGGVPAVARGIALGVMGLLGAAAGLLLAIAAANIAGMMLARAAGRRREIAIRLAMGARGGRIVRQLLTETLLLFLVGGAAGVALAVWLTSLVMRITLPGGGPIDRVFVDLSPDLRVLGFALAVSVGAGVAFGLLPALAARRPEVVDALKDGGNAAGSRRTRMRSAFVVGQLAVSLLLLLSAGLFQRALHRAVRTDLGFDPRGVLVATFDLGPYGYDGARGAGLQRQLLERVRGLPGVTAAGYARVVPLMGRMTTDGFVRGRSLGQVDFNRVSDGYFAAMRIGLVRGRAFDARDREGAPRVMVVNESAARAWWPGEAAVGQTFNEDPKTGYQVVGVVRDTRFHELDEPSLPQAFFPTAQAYQPEATLHVRTQGDPEAILPAVRRELAALNPNVPLVGVGPLSRQVGLAFLPQRLGAIVAGSFGIVGLLLAAIGLYGLVGYVVAQRTREMGLRMALGATSGNVLRLVLREAGVLVALGVVLGSAAGLGATRVLASLLFGVSATDAGTFLIGPAVLATVALLASYLPARRATKLDPMLVLRTG